jgi:hypothetical protein
MIEVLQEVTKWEDNTPNHTYHVNASGKMIGYVQYGTDTLKMFTKPLSFDKRYRKFKTVSQYHDTAAAGKVVMGSKGQTYYVNDGKCSCPGFKFRGQCKHIDMV